MTTPAETAPAPDAAPAGWLARWLGLALGAPLFAILFSFDALAAWRRRCRIRRLLDFKARVSRQVAGKALAEARRLRVLRELGSEVPESEIALHEDMALEASRQADALAWGVQDFDLDALLKHEAEEIGILLDDAAHAEGGT